MAPPSDRAYEGGDVKTQTDAANPFVAFRRFADEQLSLLINLASGSIPSSRLKKPHHVTESLEREAEEAANIMTLYARSHMETPGQDNGDFLNQNAKENESMECPYHYTRSDQLSSQDMLDLCSFLRAEALKRSLPECPARFHIPPRQLLSQALSGQGSILDVPLAYILHGSYSPIHLEHQTPFRDRGLRWREAFEDLLSFENGQDLLENPWIASDSTKTPSQRIDNMMALIKSKQGQQIAETHENLLESVPEAAGHPTTWMGYNSNRAKDDAELATVGGIARSLFDLHLSRASTDAQRKQAEATNEDEDEKTFNENDKDDNVEEAACEIDLYGHPFGKQRKSTATDPAASQSRILAHLRRDSESGVCIDGDKPGVLSTFTTTRKTILQDGTAHTKFVLKRRFSDGREEITESVHTQNALPENSLQLPKDAITKAERGEAGEKSKPGWFWS